MSDNKKIAVDAFLLGRLLSAVEGKGVLLQKLKDLPDYDNPIKALREQYEQGLREPVDLLPPSTPGGRWRQAGEVDPHEGIYDGERASLTMGKLSDDELANAAFMNYDVRPNFQDVIDGKAYMPIVYMTAVKERIRWLSRKLHEATHGKTPEVS